MPQPHPPGYRLPPGLQYTIRDAPAYRAYHVSSTPPPNFSTVLRGRIYRASFSDASISSDHFLSGLKFRTILRLVAHNHPMDYRYCSRESGIAVVVHVGEVNIHTPMGIFSALGRIMRPRHGPILVQCVDGAGDTGLLMACFWKVGRRPDNVQEQFELFGRQSAENRALFDAFDERAYAHWWESRAHQRATPSSSQAQVVQVPANGTSRPQRTATGAGEQAVLHDSGVDAGSDSEEQEAECPFAMDDANDPGVSSR